jgi:KDO2-lipid IV(A) lauroyltransferase
MTTERPEPAAPQALGRADRAWAGLLACSGRLLARLRPASLRWLGGRLAAHGGRLLRTRRHVATCNLRLCYPDLDAAQLDAMVQATLASNATGALETLVAWTAPAAGTRDRAVIEGLEHLRAALAHGRGAVLLAAHYDSMDLAFRLVSEALGQPIGFLVRGFNAAGIASVAADGRAQHVGPTFMKTDIAGFTDWIRAGNAAFYVPDLNAKRRTVFVPFFGVPTAALDAIGGVLQRTGGEVLLVWSHRRPDGRLHIGIEPAWSGFPGGDPAADAARYIAEVERQVRQHPEQYLWTHRRFRTRPPGEPDLYR